MNLYDLGEGKDLLKPQNYKPQGKKLTNLTTSDLISTKQMTSQLKLIDDGLAEDIYSLNLTRDWYLEYTRALAYQQ